MRFDGKVVLVTGSGTGIGQAIAKRFASEGASVIIMGRRREPLEATARELEAIVRSSNSNGRIRMFPGVDVSSVGEVLDMFNAIGREFNGIDVLVNNAGVSGPVKILASQPFREFRECVSIHLTGTFWMSVNALRYMNDGGRVITIATYFTEERAYEQRPYRFRTPYTSAQGAKNRLSEALAWELAEKGKRVYFIVSNPGPVHSDRIYKTVYPKAAAEFIRIGGFPGLSAVDVERVASDVLPYVGEDDRMLEKAIYGLAARIAEERSTEGSTQTHDVSSIASTIRSCLDKIREVAEKIQNNTKNMIVDGNFLTQDETAEIVLNLADVEVSRLVNGRIMPSDRVFYPVKPLIATYQHYTDGTPSMHGKRVLLSIAGGDDATLRRVRRLASALSSAGAGYTVLAPEGVRVVVDDDGGGGVDKHTVVRSMMDEDEVRGAIRKIRPDVTIHFTGNYDYTRDITSLARDEWDALVDRFINTPALISKETLNAIVQDGDREPSRFRNSNGLVIIVGPDAPSGKKVSNLIRARGEVFRGALRPFAVTATQELSEVLNSNMRIYLVLPGSIDGKEPDDGRLVDTCLYLASGGAVNRVEVVYYPDEVRDARL
ncbi:MAG: SDR family oxidoreductase [Candidatus Nitrosocaldus sp.]|nr:SDR family oxidoreductase [Candidatus Nitrosocaldus sp.]MDW7999545.1 SDR family oxidoreductase [Candidatus Nitrosocaldus sp.]